MAGLAAARTLQNAGHEVIVFEKSRGFGGRAATRRIGDYTFDSGASLITPRGSHLENVMLNEMSTEHLIKIEKPIYVHAFGRATSADLEHKAPARYCYRDGMNTLGKLLAKNLDVRLEAKVDELHRIPTGGYRMRGEDFDAIVLTPPIPQTAELLMTAGESRNFNGCRYRMCLSVLFGFDQPLDTPYHALIEPDQTEPLTWLSIESVKVPGPFRAPEGHSAMVAQMSARYSRYAYDKSDDEIIKETLIDVSRIFGDKFKSPVVSGLMRWKHSHASNTVSFESVNKPGSKLVIASDGLIGARLQQAYDVGVQAALSLLETK